MFGLDEIIREFRERAAALDKKRSDEHAEMMEVLRELLAAVREVDETLSGGIRTWTRD